MHISNLEPSVVTATNPTASDLDIVNLYSFLRLSHLLWDETVWKHISQIPPDSVATFESETSTLSLRAKGTVEATDLRHGRTLESLAAELRDLNEDLVWQSLGDLDQILLPLSSGYDSRMILAGLAQSKDLKSKTILRTYGPIESIEVKSASALGQIVGIDWRHVALDFDFLSLDSLLETHAIFGSSLPMHGMYQMEFVRKVLRESQIDAGLSLTSGFMTGVPAGQHGYMNLLDFSQSKVWRQENLVELPFFKKERNLESTLKARISDRLEDFDGSRLKQSVMLDIWTRQRNFISYYPRTLQWLLPVRSPHMGPRYINFFLSIDDSHLKGRAVVEKMFRDHFPQLAEIPSNSNNFRLAKRSWAFAYRAAGLPRKIFPANFVPRAVRDDPFMFDVLATKKARETALYPLLAGNQATTQLISQFGGERLYRDYYEQILEGNSASYERVAGVQAVLLHFIKS